MAFLLPTTDTPTTIFSNHITNSRKFKPLTVLKYDIRVGAGNRSSSSIKNHDVSGFGPGVLFSGQSSSPVQSNSKQDKEEEKQNYYLNMGYAIRTIREEFPQVFSRELSFDIFRDDIAFKDPLNTFMGIDNYKTIFGALRFNGRIFFKALWIDIISMWQPAEEVIMVRWTVHGISRVPWQSRGRFDATSEYKLDRKGKIYEHKVDNIALNSPPKFGVFTMDELVQSLGCPSPAKPTSFEFSSSLPLHTGEVDLA